MSFPPPLPTIPSDTRSRRPGYRLVGLMILLAAGWFGAACTNSQRPANEGHLPPPGDPTAPPNWVRTGEDPALPGSRFVTAFCVSSVSPRETDLRGQEQLREDWNAAIADVVRGAVPEPPADRASSLHGRAVDTAIAMLQAALAPESQTPQAFASRADRDRAYRVEIPTRAAPRSRYVPSVPMERTRYFTDGFDFFAIWTIDRTAVQQAFRRISTPSVLDQPIADAVMDPEQVRRAIGVAAAHVVDTINREGFAAGEQAEPQPTVARLVDWIAWTIAREDRVRLTLSDPGVRRMRRGDTEPLAFSITIDGPAGQPVTVRTGNHGAPIEISDAAGDVIPTRDTTGSMPTGYELASDRPATLGEWRAAMRQAEPIRATGPSASFSWVFSPAPSVLREGWIRLEADALPDGWDGWREFLPGQSAVIPWVLPTEDRIRWTFGATIEMDGVALPESLGRAIVRALMLESRLGWLADQPADAAETADAAADPRHYRVTIGGAIRIQPVEGDPGLKRAAGELRITADDGGPALGVIRVDGPGVASGGPGAALQAALDRSSIKAALRQAIADFAR